MCIPPEVLTDSTTDSTQLVQQPGAPFLRVLCARVGFHKSVQRGVLPSGAPFLGALCAKVGFHGIMQRAVGSAVLRRFRSNRLCEYVFVNRRACVITS